jgi:hypothetical protein
MARRSRVLPIVRSIRQYGGRIRRALVLELTAILFETTPFKTGHARSNWLPAMGRPRLIVAGSRAAVSYAEQQRGIREVTEEPDESTRVANLSNKVRYLPKLNRGSSAQAGAHFVEAAIAQAKVNVRARLGRLRRAR